MTSPYPRFQMEEVRLGEYNGSGEFPKTQTKVFPQEEKTDNDVNSPSTPLGYLDDWCGYTSGQGFERIQDSATKRNKLRLIFWCLVVVAAFGVFGYQTYGLVIKFLSKPVATKVSILNGKFIRFPAVTICNLNMIRKSRLPSAIQQNIDKLNTSTTGYTYYNSNSTTKRRKRRSIGHFRFRRDTVDDYFIDDSDDQIDDQYYDDYDEDVGYGDDSALDEDCLDNDCFEEETQDYVDTLQKQIAYTLTEYNETELMNMGHQFNDFVVECKWSGVDCNQGTLRKYWFQYFDLTYGNCFIFNGKLSKKRKPLRLSKTGQTYGLSLKLNIEQNEYVEVVSPTAGARITIGKRGTMPFPADEGFSVPPGMDSSAGLQTTYIEKLDPFNNKSCMASNDLDRSSIYYSDYKVTYTVTACLKHCVANNMYKTCGCTTHNFPNGKRTCDPENQIKSKCTEEVYKQFLNSTLPCHNQCKELCLSTVYSRSVSTSVWPSNADLSKVKENLQASENPTLQEYVRNGSQAIRNNLLSVNVFFSDMNVFQIKEELSYGPVEFVAEIGGNIGLFIGVSVVTVVEILELIVFMLYAGCCRKDKKKEKYPYTAENSGQQST